MPIGNFDGASQDNGDKCGVGVVLKLVDDIVYKLRLGCGGVVGNLVLALSCK